ncbi:phosphate/phosphite/phosphonate ABC transporter substrate-binding protein [Mangrovibacillus cuniculi]|uniref:Phosphate/phosphite/phosphonate ABC transporter substrate-binding protein n=1 Tax=Mangrovibacillus cuniculi TaxID=2593652 RepID=A0A7S8C9Z1_9BACI|nr:phosphate/phosphite/phosphonate ABC transporter substrate-binding protein [Mangrovibacillus cuniculi]QPC46141.1 phosphate/phosphite/phosphonate ABC transporter substrate-binding protein [Mangrovibacillus cuniculi]
MKKFLSLLFVMVLAFALAACGTESSNGNAGSGDNGTDNGGSETPEKLVMGFVPSQDSDTIADTVEPLAERLSEELGVEVEGQVMTNYTALIEAMGAGQVQIGFIPAFAYILANEQYDVEVQLKSVRHGSGFYKAQYVVAADSGIDSLADLEGKIWAYPDAASTSGFLFPAAQLMGEFDIDSAEALQTEFFAQGLSTGGHDNAAIAVYEGDADVATTFTDVRETLLEEYPDMMEKLKVIGTTDDIPNDTISVVKELDEDMKNKIKEAFLSFNEDEEMIQIMKDVYSWDAIDEATDEEYQVVRDTYQKLKDSIEL